MSRPLRLEFPGSLWHITQRGNERRPTFYQDADRLYFLELLGEAARRFKWIVTAYALMLNHFHLVLELTQVETLSRGMKWLNGRYAQSFNRRHGRVGHLFQGRFKGFLIERETYGLEVLRYVMLNPVRAGIVDRPEDYTWTSYRATIGQTEAPSWLAVDEVLAHFAGYGAIAREYYRRFVEEGVGVERSPWKDLVGAMYLGSNEWLVRVRERVESRPRPSDHVRAQTYLLRPDMSAIISAVANVMAIPERCIRGGRGGAPRTIAAWIGCYEGLLPNGEIAAALRLRSNTQVTNLVAQCERDLRTDGLIRDCVDRCLSTLGRKNWKLET